MKYFLILCSMCMAVFLFIQCKQSGKASSPGSHMPAKSKIMTPVWAANANLYEVNIRQYTPEGTFDAFRQHLPRLQQMGVDILWLMPIHPISATKRKGTLGSYYACSDYREVNSEFGTIADLRKLIDDIHGRKMHVIIDWVPHHTGWDHPWIKEHPEYYSKDSLNKIIDPINEATGKPWGWTDVAELDLSNTEMRKAMIADMLYWIDSFRIDGFRVDHAHGVPDTYWDEVSLAMADKPVFMLAEGEEPWLRNDSNFIATYSWQFHHAMNSIANGEEPLAKLDSILAKDRRRYNYGYHIYFTSNHDENSWAGTVFERLGDGHQTFAVLAATIDGMPLIYGGQEAAMDKRLEFFEKDTIDWGNYPYGGFYGTLFSLKKRNKALWNGAYGGSPQRINSSKAAYAFSRVKDKDELIVILNLTSQDQTTKLDRATGPLKNVFTGQAEQIEKGEEIRLKPWEYIVLSNK